MTPPTMRNPLPSDTQRTYALRVWTAFDLMASGQAGRDEWSDLADAINMIEALAHEKPADFTDCMPLVHRAIEGMVEAMDCPTGAMRMNADALRAMRLLADRYDVAVHRLSRGMLDKASQRVILKIANRDADVRVVG